MLALLGRPLPPPPPLLRRGVATTTEPEGDRSEKLLHALADCENARKAALREAKDAREYGHTSLARDMLEVLDNFDRALAATKQKQKQKHEDDDGIALVRRDFAERLLRHGVRPLPDATGKAFDPRHHHALFEVARSAVDGGGGGSATTKEAAEGGGENMVAMVIKPGYMIRGRLLRPSEVAVFSKTTKKKEKT